MSNYDTDPVINPVLLNGASGTDQSSAGVKAGDSVLAALYKLEAHQQQENDLNEARAAASQSSYSGHAPSAAPQSQTKHKGKKFFLTLAVMGLGIFIYNYATDKYGTLESIFGTQFACNQFANQHSQVLPDDSSLIIFMPEWKGVVHKFDFTHDKGKHSVTGSNTVSYKDKKLVYPAECSFVNGKPKIVVSRDSTPQLPPGYLRMWGYMIYLTGVDDLVRMNAIRMDSSKIAALCKQYGKDSSVCRSVSPVPQ